MQHRLNRGETRERFHSIEENIDYSQGPGETLWVCYLQERSGLPFGDLLAGLAWHTSHSQFQMIGGAEKNVNVSKLFEPTRKRERGKRERERQF
jgi:hypothetical protein